MTYKKVLQGVEDLTGLSDDAIPLAKVAGAAVSGANADITSLTALDGSDLDIGSGVVKNYIDLKVLAPTTTSIAVASLRNTIISNYGQTVENTQTLPTIESGLNFLFQIEATGVGDVHLKAGATDKIYLDGVALDDGDKITCTDPAIGDYIVVWSIQTGASTFDWIAESGRGIFSDGGV